MEEVGGEDEGGRYGEGRGLVRGQILRPRGDCREGEPQRLACGGRDANGPRPDPLALVEVAAVSLPGRAVEAEGGAGGDAHVVAVAGRGPEEGGEERGRAGVRRRGQGRASLAELQRAAQGKGLRGGS